MNKVIARGIVFLSAFFIFSCSQSIEPSAPVEIENLYVPLNAGDLRQVVRQYDSSTTLYRMLYNTKRQDGKNIFAFELTFGTHVPDTGYYFIDNGFFKLTNLSVGSDPSNPFDEEILAEINPKDGDRFVSTVDYPDTFFLAAKYYQFKSTICGSFNDVFGFISIFQHAGVPDTDEIEFYAKHIGYIGTFSKYLTMNYDVSYLKVGNKEYGTMWPAKNLSPILNVMSQSNRQLFKQMFYLGNKCQLTRHSPKESLRDKLTRPKIKHSGQAE